MSLDSRIINQGGKILVDTAESLGRELAQKELTKSQIRNIYGAVKKMEKKGFDYHKFLMLKPKLAYAARRHGKGVQRLKEVLTEAIELVGDDKDKFPKFVDFFEAILAYHKAYGGKD